MGEIKNVDRLAAFGVDQSHFKITAELGQSPADVVEQGGAVGREDFQDRCAG